MGHGDWLTWFSMGFSDDMEPNSMASIPGMGIPEQLKAAMEQEQTSKASHGFGISLLSTVLYLAFFHL